MDNQLYYGDNLEVLRRHIKDESVDLIYLDPPFNSNATYNVLFDEDHEGAKAAAQIKAFEDTWHWDMTAARLYKETVEGGGDVSNALQAFYKLLGANGMMAYLAMMAPRLIELRRVMKPEASIFLHCDPTASHYLKLLMDSVFGPGNYRNEIVWHYTGWNKKLKDKYESRHDIILFYSRSKKQVFNGFSLPWDSPEEYVKVRKQKVLHNDLGQAYVLSDAGGGKRVPRLVEEAMEYGKPIDDVWTIDKLNNSSKERLGYPTQKPEALLERIVRGSTNRGAVVLDPFCGCGTAISVAQKLGRTWIGIDITHIAINLIKKRLSDSFGTTASYKTLGEPTTVQDAQELASSDPFQFQWWALGLVGARPVEEKQKKGSDQGIDGRLIFHDEAEGGKTKQVILSVKAGYHISSLFVRDLRAVIEREKAQIGVLISMQEPTQPMRKEAASAGFYNSPGARTSHPRLQILTIAELLEGKRIDMPFWGQGNVTFKKARKTSIQEGEQVALGL